MQASSSASVGPGKSVVDRKECSTNGRDAAKAVDKRGGWRVSSGGGVSNSGSRTRPPRDARKVAGKLRVYNDCKMFNNGVIGF